MTIAAHLRYWMDRRELNGAQLAEAAKVHRAQVTRWLRGDQCPSGETRKRLADALGMDAESRLALFEAVT